MYIQEPPDTPQEGLFDMRISNQSLTLPHVHSRRTQVGLKSNLDPNDFDWNALGYATGTTFWHSRPISEK